MQGPRSKQHSQTFIFTSCICFVFCCTMWCRLKINKQTICCFMLFVSFIKSLQSSADNSTHYWWCVASDWRSATLQYSVVNATPPYLTCKWHQIQPQSNSCPCYRPQTGVTWTQICSLFYTGKSRDRRRQLCLLSRLRDCGLVVYNRAHFGGPSCLSFLQSIWPTLDYSSSLYPF